MLLGGTMEMVPRTATIGGYPSIRRMGSPSTQSLADDAGFQTSAPCGGPAARRRMAGYVRRAVGATLTLEQCDVGKRHHAGEQCGPATSP